MYRLGLYLAQPGFLLGLIVLLAAANLWRNRKETRRRLLLLTVPLVLLAVWCTPVVGQLALGSLEWPYPPLEERPADAEAIVVLSGYVKLLDEAGTNVELGGDTMRRCLRAAEVYRQGERCPVVLSGGKLDPSAPGPTLAQAMRNFLEHQPDVHGCDLVTEDCSTTTYENAVETSRLLEERGIHRVVLVTDAIHLGRAAACFRKQGIDVVPCGCRYHTTHMEWSLAAFVPDLSSGSGCQEALHEWLGVLWYRLHGRM
jgi:uncharacterized SAM-binding protein YcdF (DUF218 family)